MLLMVTTKSVQFPPPGGGGRQSLRSNNITSKSTWAYNLPSDDVTSIVRIHFNLAVTQPKREELAERKKGEWSTQEQDLTAK